MPKQKARGASVKRPSSRNRSSGARKSLVNRGSAGRDGNIQEDFTPNQTQEARTLVLEALPEIVQGLIKKAADGGYQQAKLLLELFEIPAAETPGFSDEGKRQLCDALLEAWKVTSPKAKLDSPSPREITDECEISE